MAYTSVLVYRAAGQQVPKDYIDKLLLAFPTCFGTVVNSDEGFSAIASPEALDWDQFNQLQEKYRDSPSMYWFGNFPEEFDEEDCQPFDMVVDQEGNQLVVAFVTGALPRYDDKEEGHSGAHHMVDSYLRTKIGQMVQQADGSIPDLITLLQPEHVKQDMQNVLSDNGTITICLADDKDGTYMTFTPDDNKQFRNFPWGSTTNHLGTEVIMGSAHPEGGTPAEVPLTPKERLAAMLGKPKISLPKPASKVNPPGIHAVPDPVKPPETATAIPESAILPEGMTRDASGTLWFESSSKVATTRNEIKADYAEHAGYIPRGEAGKGIMRRPKVLVAKEIVAKYGTLLQSGKDVGKDTAPKHVKTDNPPPTTVPVRVEEEPILNAPEKAAFESWYLSEPTQKSVGADSKEIMSHEQMLEVEKKYATFPELLAMDDWDEAYGWPFHVILDGVKKNPKAFAIGFMNLSVCVQRAGINAAPEFKPPVEVPAGPTPAKPAVAPASKSVVVKPKVNLPTMKKAHNM